MQNKYSNEQISQSLDLWNDYFNTAGLMTDEEFEELTLQERIEIMKKCGY